MRLNFSMFLASICMFMVFTTHAQQEEYGKASYYSAKFAGKRTASGESFNPDKLTCAHRSLPFGTILLVTNLENGRSVKVRVNDRGPFKGGRVVDLSPAAARNLHFIQKGEAKVKIDVIDRGVSVAKQMPVNVSLRDYKSKSSDNKPKIRVGPQPKSKSARKPQPKPKAKVQPKPIAGAKAAPKAYAYDAPNLTAKGVSPATTALPKGVYTIGKVSPKTKNFGIQIGAFGSMDKAMALVKLLESKHFKNVLLSVSDTPGSRTPYKVLIGPYPTNTMAASNLRSAQKKYKVDGFVVSL